MNKLERALDAYRSEVKPASERRHALEAAVLGAGPVPAGALTTVIGLLAGAAVGGAILAGVIATRPEPHTPSEALPAIQAPLRQLETETARPAAVEPPPATPEPPAQSPDVAPTEATATPKPQRSPKRRARAAASGPLEDMNLLRRAESLINTDAKAALVLLRRHRADYPESPLSLERAALRVRALCGAGQSAEGRAAREAFLRRHPSSPYVGRVKAACVDGD